MVVSRRVLQKGYEMEIKSRFDFDAETCAKNLNLIYSKQDQDIANQLAVLMASGWKLFEKRSTYYGNHPEYGDADLELRFLFAPWVEFTQWENSTFSH